MMRRSVDRLKRPAKSGRQRKWEFLEGVYTVSRVTVFFAAVLVFINLPYGLCGEQSDVDWNARGIEAFGAGNYTEALSHFDKAYEVEKKPLYLLNAALALSRQGKYHATIQYCRRALGLDPAPDMKSKVESLLSRSEQITKENLTKRTKEIGREQDWAAHVAEQQAIERQEAQRKAERIRFTDRVNQSGSNTHVSTPERSSPKSERGSDYTYEEGPYPPWYWRHHRHHKHNQHDKDGRKEQHKDGRKEQHKDGAHKQSSGKTHHR
jgi:tetratricopeptide (TPR) repeat protein